MNRSPGRMPNSEAWQPNSNKNVAQLPFTAMACQARELSYNLEKVSHRVPRFRDTLRSYAKRFEDVSSILFFGLRKLRMSDPYTNDFYLYDILEEILEIVLGSCFIEFAPFYALCTAFATCGDATNGKPVITITRKGNHEKEVSTIWPLNKLGHKSLEQNLLALEISLAQVFALLQVLRESGSSIELEGQVMMKLGQRLPSVLGFDWPWGDRSYTVKCAVNTANSRKRTVRTEIRHIGGSIQVEGMEYPSAGGTSSLRVPDFSSLKVRLPGLHHGLVRYVRLTELDDQDDAKTLNSSAATIAQEIINNADHGITGLSYDHIGYDKTHVGRLLLQDEVLVSAEFGRPKRKTVMLFENRLLFSRHKSASPVILYDIPIEDLLLVSHSPKGDGLASLTLFWDADPDGPPEVIGTKIYLEDRLRLKLWAGFLALALNSGKSGDGIASIP